MKIDFKISPMLCKKKCPQLLPDLVYSIRSSQTVGFILLVFYNYLKSNVIFLSYWISSHFNMVMLNHPIFLKVNIGIDLLTSRLYLNLVTLINILSAPLQVKCCECWQKHLLWHFEMGTIWSLFLTKICSYTF